MYLNGTPVVGRIKTFADLTPIDTWRKVWLNSNFEQVETEYRDGKPHIDTVYGVQLKYNLQHKIWNLIGRSMTALLSVLSPSSSLLQRSSNCAFVRARKKNCSVFRNVSFFFFFKCVHGADAGSVTGDRTE